MPVVAQIVVAIVDGGCLLTHADLAANIWQNTAEVNGVDGVNDDGNGYVDDKNGWDAFANDGTIPTDNPWYACVGNSGCSFKQRQHGCRNKLECEADGSGGIEQPDVGYFDWLRLCAGSEDAVVDKWRDTGR